MFNVSNFRASKDRECPQRNYGTYTKLNIFTCSSTVEIHRSHRVHPDPAFPTTPILNIYYYKVKTRKGKKS